MENGQIKNKKQQSKIIKFDDEIITRSEATKLLLEKFGPGQNSTSKKDKNNEAKHSKKQNIGLEGNNNIEHIKKQKKRKKRKKNKSEDLDKVGLENDETFSEHQHSDKVVKLKLNNTNSEGDIIDQQSDYNEVKTKKRKLQKMDEINVKEGETADGETIKRPPKKPKKPKESEATAATTTQDSSGGGEQSKKTISIREMKRQRHEKLMEKKKVKADKALQQKAHTYLSNWKYNKELWKFEKLRQIWLQLNMYNAQKIPKDVWPILLDYFNTSKGQARESVLKEAIRILEIEKDVDEIKQARARDIVQHLKE